MRPLLHQRPQPIRIGGGRRREQIELPTPEESTPLTLPAAAEPIA
jgi:hypothetical protein